MEMMKMNELKNDFETVEEKINLVDVLRYYNVDTSKNPTECPFHVSKKKISFSFNNAVFHCFCADCEGQKGNLFHFIEIKENCNRYEALKKASEIAGIELHHKKLNVEEIEKLTNERKLGEKRFEILTTITDLFHKNLSKEVKEKIKKERGWTDETIDKFKIGYSISGIKKKLIELEFLEKEIRGGIVSEKDYEYFQDRIMFPYMFNGITKYFIGRKTNKSPNNNFNEAKYIKLKSDYGENILFNLDSLNRTKELFITEGIADCISIDQAGFSCISPVTIRFKKEDYPRILKYCKDKIVYIANDNEDNKAGQVGALDTARFLFENGITNIKIVEIPKDEDVEKIDMCEYLKDESNKKKAIEKLINKHSKHIIDFFIDLIEDKQDLDMINNTLTLLSYCEEIILDPFLDKFCKKTKIKSTSANKKIKEIRRQREEAEVYEFTTTERKLKETSGETNDNSLHGFIFDETQVCKVKPFCMHTLLNDEDECFAYGLKLPRNEDVIDNKGNIIGKRQIWRPVIITSKNKLIVYSKDFIREKKILYEDIPEENIKRWSLDSIKQFIGKGVGRVDKKELFNSIKNQYKKFCYFNEDEWYSIHTLWDIGTYFFMLFSHYPLFEMRGITGSAKSKVMTLSGFITFNSTGNLTNPSESTLFRLTHEQRPTKYIDEAENLFLYNKNTGQYEPDVRAQLINESYFRGGKVPRQEKFGNTYKTVFYSCYSPTMLGSIKGLRGATETRAITHIITKNPFSDSRGNLEIEDYVESKLWGEIRDKLYIFSLQNYKDILDLKDEIDYSKIKGRNKQIWQPLLILAKFIDKKLYNKVKDFAGKMSIQKSRDIISDGTLDFDIIVATRDLILMKKQDVTNNFRVYVKDIKEKLSLIQNREYVAPKTISSKLDNLGFKQFRDTDTNRGSFFELTYDKFKDILEPACEQLFAKEELKDENK